ncbi:patatin-like phospholipase family protein [Bdellovibrio sp. HCB337]|uniref:patatin-like phospholipase family protein n=1 Tax=Bdellovibrio sp. HCB337 TaxID=3394358 RepID=UPI0039A67AF8
MLNKGLVLSGGGARGAYQVGVLSAIADIAQSSGIHEAFNIYTGVSAGAINATFLAAGADDFTTASKSLVDLWSQLTSDQVFYSDVASIGKIGLNWMKSASVAGFVGPTPGQALLDTTPLHNLLKDRLPFAKIQNNIDRGILKALAITAMDYQSSTAITFVQGKKELPDWQKSRRYSEKAQINAEHVLASSAIPLLFPPVGVDQRFFGDGCVRNTAPCSPSIYLGAQKILVIGVRRQKGTAYENRIMQSAKAPSIGRVLNVLLNSVMLDGVELDVERLERINSLIDQIPPGVHQGLTYKKVDFVWVSPSADIGEIAAQKHMKLPHIIRYLLKGLGSISETSEIVSYLLFDPSFCTQLIEIGYEDGMKQKEEIRRFLES